MVHERLCRAQSTIYAQASGSYELGCPASAERCYATLNNSESQPISSKSLVKSLTATPFSDILAGTPRYSIGTILARTELHLDAI